MSDQPSGAHHANAALNRPVLSRHTDPLSEPARDHVANALQLLLVCGTLIDGGRGMVFQTRDVEAIKQRLEQALKQP